jgi:hypothetical protein
MKKIILLLLLLPLFLFANETNTSNDSLKDKKGKKNHSIYPLNDPRNPDCPCHELQRKADEEYRKQQLKEKYSNANQENQNDEEVKSPTKRKRLFKFRTTGKKDKKFHLFNRKKKIKLLDDCPTF